MKSRLNYKSLLLNILVMVFMMNTSLAHSTCHIGGDMSSGDMSSDSVTNDSSAAPSQQAMANMPCHEGDSLETNVPQTNSSEENIPTVSSSSANALNQCCSDCSVIILPMDRLQTITTLHASITSIILIPSISRTIELLFRPPITALS